MKKNEEYNVECIDITDMAAGVCRIEDQVVFVYDLLPGEKARIKIIKVNKKFAIGKVIEHIQKSKARQELVCKYARLCGGCQLEHIRYEDQLKIKTQWMKELFAPISVRNTLGNKNPLYYRNKAQFPVQIKDGNVLTGFYRKHSNDIVDEMECKIQSKEINDMYAWIKARLTVKNAQGLRHIFIRSSYTTLQAQVVFIGTHENEIQKLVPELVQTFPQIVSVVFNYNTRNDNVILGEEYKVLYGSDSIIEMCMKNEVQLHFKSFFQVNPVMMETLYQCAIDGAKLSGKETCIDMYAGAGTIGMAISSMAKRVIGVEIVEEAVINAKANLARNQIQNCEYICQDATEFAKECKEDIDVVFVDPPRKGMSEQGIQDIVRLQPEKIMYISCNPKTLKRDLLAFEQLGYTCLYVQPVDMFAYTTGVECVAAMERTTK